MEAIHEYSPKKQQNDIWSELRFPSEDEKIRSMIDKGFDVGLLPSLVSLVGFSSAEIVNAVKIATSTLSRRKKDGYFSAEESDRFYRLVEVIDKSTDLFEGDRKAAVEWLRKPAPALGNKPPLEMLDTTANTLAVLRLITRMEYGVYS